MAFHYQLKVKAGYFTTQIKYRWQHALLSESRDSAPYPSGRICNYGAGL